MTMKSFFERKHIWLILVYLICYLLAFRLLEMRDMKGIHIIHTALDERIPFCEYFIVPYLLWFFYIAAAVLFFACFQKNTKEYWQLILSLGIGMTLPSRTEEGGRGIFYNGQADRNHPISRILVFF